MEGETGLDKSSRLTSKKVVDDFLDKFGITVNHIDDCNGDLPLFDALNRVINAKTISQVGWRQKPTYRATGRSAAS